MPWAGEEPLKAALEELRKHPSAKTVKNVASTAIKHIREYKRVVHMVEHYVWRSKREARLPGFHCIDAILRACRGKDREMFVKRFALHMKQTLVAMEEVSEKDKASVGRTLTEWQTKGYYEKSQVSEVGGDKFLALAKPKSLSGKAADFHPEAAPAKASSSPARVTRTAGENDRASAGNDPTAVERASASASASTSAPAPASKATGAPPAAPSSAQIEAQVKAILQLAQATALKTQAEAGAGPGSELGPGPGAELAARAPERALRSPRRPPPVSTKAESPRHGPADRYSPAGTRASPGAGAARAVFSPSSASPAPPSSSTYSSRFSSPRGGLARSNGSFRANAGGSEGSESGGGPRFDYNRDRDYGYGYGENQDRRYDYAYSRDPTEAQAYTASAGGSGSRQVVREREVHTFRGRQITSYEGEGAGPASGGVSSAGFSRSPPPGPEDRRGDPAGTAFVGSGRTVEYSVNGERVQSKRELCRRFQRGQCTRGDACWYSHEGSTGGPYSSSAHLPENTGRETEEDAFDRRRLSGGKRGPPEPSDVDDDGARLSRKRRGRGEVAERDSASYRDGYRDSERDRGGDRDGERKRESYRDDYGRGRYRDDGDRERDREGGGSGRGGVDMFGRELPLATSALKREEERGGAVDGGRDRDRESSDPGRESRDTYRYKDGESRGRESRDRESRDRESRDRESRDRESRDRECRGRESRDRETESMETEPLRDRRSRDRGDERERTRPGTRDGELRSPPSMYKTRLCWNYEQGQCRYDDKCRFAHGVSDLASHKGKSEPSPPSARVLESSEGSRESANYENTHIKSEKPARKRRSRFSDANTAAAEPSRALQRQTQGQAQRPAQTQTQSRTQEDERTHGRGPRPGHVREQSKSETTTDGVADRSSPHQFPAANGPSSVASSSSAAVSGSSSGPSSAPKAPPPGPPPGPPRPPPARAGPTGAARPRTTLTTTAAAAAAAAGVAGASPPPGPPPRGPPSAAPPPPPAGPPLRGAAAMVQRPGSVGGGGGRGEAPGFGHTHGQGQGSGLGGFPAFPVPGGGGVHGRGFGGAGGLSNAPYGSGGGRAPAGPPGPPGPPGRPPAHASAAAPPPSIPPPPRVSSVLQYDDDEDDEDEDMEIDLDGPDEEDSAKRLREAEIRRY